jgi:hypothetical protein
VSWEDFATAWSEAFDGYDPRRAWKVKQRFMFAVYKGSGIARVRTSVTMVISLVLSVSVPPLAWLGGVWLTVAALAVLLGQATDVMTRARAIRAGRPTRLGLFYQALVERFAEVCWLVSFLALGARPTSVVLCAFVVWIHEYLRAKLGGTAIHRAGTSTVGDKPFRVGFTLAALLLAALISPVGTDLAAGVVTMVVLCWVALGLIGAAQLFTTIRKALT